jgi:beta-phosphoglucomutase-like phosphatase (HAD superfamily)
MSSGTPSVAGPTRHLATQSLILPPISPKWLLLDADNTLFNTEGPANTVACGVANQMLGVHGKTRQYAAEEYIARFASVPFRESVRQVALENGIQLSDAEIQKWDREELEQNISAFRKKTEPAPGVHDAVKWMAIEYDLMVVSSSHGDRLGACFEASGLDALLPPNKRLSAVTSLETPAPKPDPAVVDFAIKQTGLAAHKHLGFEDSVTGARTYQAANGGNGVPCVAYLGLVPAETLGVRLAKMIDHGVDFGFDEWRHVEEFLGALRDADGRTLQQFSLKERLEKLKG